MTGKASREVSALKDSEKVKLWDYLRSIKPEIEAEGYDRRKLCEMARLETKIDHLSEANIVRACKTLDIRMGRRKAVGEGTRMRRVRDELADHAARLAQGESRLAQLAADLASLTRLVEETAESLSKRWTMENGRAVPVRPR